MMMEDEKMKPSGLNADIYTPESYSIVDLTCEYKHAFHFQQSLTSKLSKTSSVASEPAGPIFTISPSRLEEGGFV